MIDAGMSVARINASHSDPEEIRSQVGIARKAASNRGKEIGILLDLKGRKISVGAIRGGRGFRPGQCSSSRRRGPSPEGAGNDPERGPVQSRDGRSAQVA